MKRLLINKTALLFSFLLFLVCMSYSNTLYSPFVLDDYSAFVDNRNLYLEDISVKSLSHLFHTRFGSARVIPIASFALDHYIAQGKSIINYHVTNILIHVLTTTSIAFLLAGLLKTRPARGALKFFRPAYFILAVCGLWALSPLQTNGVTYLVQRMTSMAAMFYIAACGFYIHARLAKTYGLRFFYFASFLFASCGAFFSKENSWILPLALLTIEFVFLKPDSALHLLQKSRWYHWLVIILIVALLAPFASSYFERLLAGFSGRHFTMPERLYTELRIVVLYMSLLLFPLPGRLNLEHDIPLSTSILTPPTALLSLLLITGLLWLAFFLRKKQPFISFGIFWFFLNLVIESTFVPLELIFEHRVYLPSVGFFLALVSALDHLFARYEAVSHPEIKKIVFLLFIITLSISSILTTLRNDDWRDKVTIYQDSMEKSPAKPRAVSNYSMALGKAGQYDKCAEYGMKVQELGVQGYEDYMNSATNTLSCLLLQEKYKEAVETGEAIRKQILQKDMDYINAGAMNKYMFNLSVAYSNENLYRKAYETFLVSLFRAPYDASTYIGINKLFVRAHENEQGRKDLKLGDDINEVPVRLAKIAFKYRQYGYAEQYIKEAVKLEASPEIVKPIEEKLANAVAQNKLIAHEANIGNNETYSTNRSFRFYLKSFDFILKIYKPLQGAFAGWFLDQAEQIDPRNLFLPVYRARWHIVNGKLDEAIAVLEDFLADNENFLPALEQLGVCYQKKKEHGKSVPIFKRILKLYHGHGNWQNYLSYIYQYEDKINETGRTPLDYY